MQFEMKCEVCGQGPRTGTSIFRTGGYGPGVNPHWRCEPHQTGDIPADVYEIVSIIESANGAKE
jgi:hypothetical protein